ncbi:MAG: ABC transporter ATP-binding protein [Dehalococcoidia bacterium]|jgi:putative ABC transport system ATP-binding protein|nr:MAG: putative ABC transport system ATP-binding protein [Chloroflexota bacterium]|tara:strand:- start:860 stop:1543 length:684 start_codon:yes stop_codon:yes gene_type:complete
MIELSKISKDYYTEAGTVHALRNIDVKIQSGEFVAIMGQSGSGKSTMLNILGCLDQPTTGQYSLDGINVGDKNDTYRSILRREKFGFVFQSYNLVPRLTAVEQVELPLIYQGASNKREIALEALARLNLDDRAHHFPQQLSGGQQQRVAIARSLVVQPQVVFADEPTGALDTQSGKDIMKIFSELSDEGITIVLITHEQHIADQSSRILEMSDGQLVFDSLHGRNSL